MPDPLVPEFLTAQDSAVKTYQFSNVAIALLEERDLPEKSEIVILTSDQIPWLRRVLADFEKKL
jgi:hypothetical protein